MSRMFFVALMQRRKRDPMDSGEYVNPGAGENLMMRMEARADADVPVGSVLGRSVRPPKRSRMEPRKLLLFVFMTFIPYHKTARVST